MGTLLIEAYESSVAMSKTTKFIEKESSVDRYGRSLFYSRRLNSYPSPLLSVSEAEADLSIQQNDHVNMFKVPPPPFVVKESSDGSENRNIYTIVPGQIEAAARRRGMAIVYGGSGEEGIKSYWIDSLDFIAEEKLRVEESYYYKPYDEDYSDSDSSDDEDNAELPVACDTNEDGNNSDATQQFSIPVKLQSSSS